MTKRIHAVAAGALAVAFILTGVARAAEEPAAPSAGAACAEQDARVAAQGAEIEKLKQRIEELEDELDLEDMN